MSDDAEKQVCPLPHPGHPDRASVAAPGAVLCRGHISKLVETLTQLATFDAEADEAAHDQTLSRKAGQPLSGDRERPLVIDARYTDHSREVDTILRSWALLVVEERRVSVPFLSDQGATPGLCAFLAVHHEWSVSQTWADDYAGEVLALGRRAWSLLHPSGRRQFTNKIMRCVELDEVDGSRCPGNLWAFLTPDDPYAEAKSTIICDCCGHEVTSDRWFSYGKKVFAAEEATRAKPDAA